MPRIGFEWQFPHTDLRFYHQDAGSWHPCGDVPSKGRVFYSENAGIAIESDGGEVEIISDPVETWVALRQQLLFIGDLLTLITGRTVEIERLSPELGKFFAADSNLVVDSESKKPVRMANLQRGVLLPVMMKQGGRLKVGTQEVPPSNKPALTLGTAYGNLLILTLHDPIVQWNFTPAPAAPVVFPRDDRLAVGAPGAREGAKTRGVVQATLDVPLVNLPARLGSFDGAIIERAEAWLKGMNPSPTLYAFVVLLHYSMWVFATQTLTSDDGPKAGFPLLPRTNLRSLYRMVLEDQDRTAFDAKVNNNLTPDVKSGRVCPRPYSLGNKRDLFANPLTIGEWLDSIRHGDPGTAADLDQDVTGMGPRGGDYDKLSPPLGYPAHTPHAARPVGMFTYSMGKMNATRESPAVIVEYRDTQDFGGGQDSLAYEAFANVVVAAARQAGLVVE
ncbi:hypothetical protein [Nonomuraea sp. NPDC049141]|uniref:hypothetical protein n=1 Tax=Nonomuraea sp. NPDC049141 TaxID=3155500 RepID=UPI0033C5775A